MRYLINNKNQKIAYDSVKGKSPGIVFIHGLNSDMNGIKAQNIKKYAIKNKLSFIRFDCRGHGKSFGKFEDFTITDWKNDLLYVLDKLTTGPQILIGSSMGGWLMILAYKMRKKRIAALIGLAAATDFGKILYKNLTQKNKNELSKNGITQYHSYGFSYFLTKKFFINAEKNNILSKKFSIQQPIILIHGIKDDVVNTDMPKKIMHSIKGKNIQINYLKFSDHRLSSKKDLMIINNSIDSIRSLIKLC
jgi:pimeloyl-ACP methyl ester carboxylesterase